MTSIFHHRRSFLKAFAAAGAGAALPPLAEAKSDGAPAPSANSKVGVADVRTYKLKDAIFVQVVADMG